MDCCLLSLDIIHKFIRDKYSKRFPELESLVPNALDYIRTVKVLCLFLIYAKFILLFTLMNTLTACPLERVPPLIKMAAMLLLFRRAVKTRLLTQAFSEGD